MVGLCVMSAVFIEVAFFEKDIPKSSGIAALALAIGCLIFGTIIGLLVMILDVLQKKTNQ